MVYPLFDFFKLKQLRSNIITPEEIKRRAKEIHDVSLDYHLSHAVLACNQLVQDMCKENSEKKIEELNKKLKKIYESGDQRDISQLEKEKAALKAPFRIFVEYVNGMDKENARVVRLPDSNQMVISLPKKLLDESRDPDGSPNIPGIKALRKRMAHELGHIALYLKELLAIDGLQGSKLLPEEAEKDVNIFAEELLRLRNERNEELSRLGGWQS